jgi:hypothetical protein
MIEIISMKKVFFTALFFLLLADICPAQQLDTLAGLKLFINVCNAYKQLPVQLDVDITNATNYVLSEKDTAHLQARFCFQKEGSYIRYGELEQVANDSLLLFVSNKVKRMIVYKNRRSTAGQLQAYLGLQQNDSSILRMAGRYKATQWAGGNDGTVKDTAMVEITGRANVPHTLLAKESVQVEYDPRTLEPYGVIQLRRRLIPIDKKEYDRLSALQEANPRLLVQDNANYFLVCESTTRFQYKHITHQDMAIPVTVNDRVTADSAGNYTPVNRYSEFFVSKGF